MKKTVNIVLSILLTFFLSLMFIELSKTLANDTLYNTELKEMFTEYYQEGYYTKETKIYIDPVKINDEVRSYFHNNVTDLEKTTIYKYDELWLSTNYGYSGYGSSKNGKLTQFTVSKEGIKSNEKEVSSLPKMEDYYLTLHDFILGSHQSAHSNNNKLDLTKGWIKEGSVYYTTNSDVLNGFRLFTAPLWLYTNESRNYLDFVKATITEKGNQLILKLWVKKLDAEGKLVDNVEKDGNFALFSKAIIEKTVNPFSPDGMPLRLWYDEEAVKNGEGNGYGWMLSGNDPYTNDHGWTNWSLPIGNGYFGANVFGRTETERIQITDKTLSNPWQIPDAENGYPQKGGLNNFSETYLDFNHTNSEVSNYERYLDLNTAISGVEYDYNGVTYKREYFTSYPDKALVIYLDSSESGSLDFTLRPTIPFEKEYALYPGDNFSKEGQVESWVDGGVGTVELTGKMGYYDIDFMAMYKVYIEGGTMEASTVTTLPSENENGSSHSHVGDGTIVVSGASRAYIVVTLGTDYELDSEIFLGGQYDRNKLTSKTTLEHTREKVNGYMNDINTLLAGQSFMDSYIILKDRHIHDYQELFNRVELDLDYNDSDLLLTTDVLLEEYNKNNPSKYLENLFFQYGRYSLIAASRPGTLPAHLQGAWNTYDISPWSSGYWHNINVQMNYWPAFTTNLAETFDAYIDLNKAYMEEAEYLASMEVKNHNSDMYNKDGGNGWTIGVAGNAYFISSDRSPGNMGFTTQLFWDYYRYTKDSEVLEKIYPVLANAARYITKSVKQDENGYYLVEHCDSPEQWVNGVWYYTTGATYAQSLSYLNNYYTLLAAKEMGIDLTNKDLLSSEEYSILKTVMNQLDLYDPINIGLSGQVKEFREENYYGELGDPYHRHISQLVGLYPGNLINSSTPAWLDAAAVTLEGRSGFSDNYGWVFSHKMSLYSRIKDSENAYKEYQKLLDNVVAPNLWTKYAEIYQSESNYGATAGVAEMLLQSHEGYIEPLAALPSNWNSGSYKGLVAEGNFEVACSWEDNLINDLYIKSNKGGQVKVKYPSITNAKVVDSKGNTINYEVVDSDIISFESVEGETYYITGFVKVNTPDAPTNFLYTRERLGEFNFTWDKVSDAVSYNIYKAVGNASTYTLIDNVTTTNYKYNPNNSELNSRTTFVVTAVNSEGRESKRSLCYFNPIDTTAKINSANWVLDENGNYQVTVTANDAVRYNLYEKKSGKTEFSKVSESTSNVLTYSAYSANSVYAVTTVSSYDIESEIYIVEKYYDITGTNVFTPTLEASNHIYPGFDNYTFGYDNLTDGVFGGLEGRYSSKIDVNSIFDATIDLKNNYIINEIRIYDYQENGDYSYTGKNLTIEVYNGETWKKVITLSSNSEFANYRRDADGTGYKYLSFNLGDIDGEKVRIYINGAIDGKAISFYEIKCFGYKSTKEESKPLNTFIPTTEALSYVHGGWDNYSFGYEKLTDGSFVDLEGRYSSKTDVNAIFDATINFGAYHNLKEIRIYDYKGDYTYAGNNILIEVYSNGNWLEVLKLHSNSEFSKYQSQTPDDTGYKYLSFDLNGYVGEKIRISIDGAVSGKAISFYEIKVLSSEVVETNVFSDKTFIPTQEGLNAVFPGWGNYYFGYENLTDGKFAELEGRYSSISGNGLMDGTIELGGNYILNQLIVYDYTNNNYADARFAGTNFKVEIYSNGSWITVVNSTNSELLSHRSSAQNKPVSGCLVFDLGGIAAEKVRIYVSAPVGTDTISFYEIECLGYQIDNTQPSVKTVEVTKSPTSLYLGEKLNEGEVEVTVTYSNGTKEVYSGAALTFDYSNFNKDVAGIYNINVKVNGIDLTASFKVLVRNAKSEEEVYKVLIIANSYGDDTVQWVHEIADDLGIDIEIANLYIGGCTLSTHLTNLNGDLAAYQYVSYDKLNKTWSRQSNTSIATALNYKDWDYVVLQQGSHESGLANTYDDINTVMDKVLAIKNDVKFIWNMTWAYQQNSGHANFGNYNHDQMTMYNQIVNAVQSKVLTNDRFLFVVPNGTAIQNVRTSYIGDNLCRDVYCHLTLDLGRYIAGLTFVKALTGVDINEIKFSPGLSDYEKAVVIEAVNNAITNPFEITNSKYTEKVSSQFSYNVLEGKTFVPTQEGLNAVFPSWDGIVYFGYETLTDGKMGELDGRFSTTTSGLACATIDLEGNYKLDSIRFYDYKQNANYMGSGLVVEVYLNGNWVEVVNCSSNSLILSNRVSYGSEVGLGWIEFDLNDVNAQQVRFTIPGTHNNTTISIYEIECYGVNIN